MDLNGVKNKVCFLDFDGVLCTAKTNFRLIDIYSVGFLQWVCEAANVKVVITSTWRFSNPKEFFDNLFGFNNIHNDWATIDLRDDNANRIRGDEIQEWLNRHPEVDQYLILDDDTDMLRTQMVHFRKICAYDGIKYNDMEFIRKYFGLDWVPYDCEKYVTAPSL